MPEFRESWRKFLYRLPNGRPVYDSGEFDSSRRWYQGAGINVGCGFRQPVCDMLRIDNDPETLPDVLWDFSVVPWPCTYYYQYALFGHSLEHVCNWEAVLNESLRHADYTVLVLWDRIFAGFMRDHCFAWTLKEAIQILSWSFNVVDYGIALMNQSYYVVVDNG